MAFLIYILSSVGVQLEGKVLVMFGTNLVQWCAAETF